MGGEGTRGIAKTLLVEMPDGSVWGVPVDIVARDRAAHYAKEFDGDINRSLAEDTIPLFADDIHELYDWAANNMNWSDVETVAVKVRDTKPMTRADMQDAWVNGDKDLSWD
jgi:hypothetical protein